MGDSQRRHASRKRQRDSIWEQIYALRARIDAETDEGRRHELEEEMHRLHGSLSSVNKLLRGRR